ncbi:MAG: glycosyltransferase family 1 protein [Rickettsiales bacterium]|nr:glycosyltransferase family 1 protein [Rickettsiales bacterium]
MKKNLVFDFNIILQGGFEDKARAGVFWTEYEILREFIKKYSENFDFYANCSCSEKFYNEKLIKKFPEFKSIKYINLNSQEETYTKILNSYIKQLKFVVRNSKNIFTKIVLIIISQLLRVAKIFRYFLSKKVKEKSFVGIFQSFSGTNGIPVSIQKNNNLQKFTVVYDVMPFSHPQYFFTKKQQSKKSESFANKMKTITKDTIIFTDSAFARDEFVKYFPQYKNNKIIIDYLAADSKKYFKSNGIDKTILTKYKIPTDRKYILSLCSLNKRKNLNFLVDSFVDFLEKNPNIKDLDLVLAGPRGWLMDEMFKSIKNADKYKDRIILTGFVDEKDINTIYNGAFAFIFPSLLEGFGLPVLEAMQCGVPVISSNATSLPEVYGNSAIPINPTKKEELINAISSIYHDENLRKEYIKKGLEQAKKFTWEKTVNVMVNEYLK